MNIFAYVYDIFFFPLLFLYQVIEDVLTLYPHPGQGYGNPLQYSCLENPMDRGVWWTTIHGITKSQTQLKRLSTHDFIP